MALVERANAAVRRVPVAAVWGLGLLPLAWLVAQAVAGALGPDPVKAIERDLGLRALQLLVAVLCVSPLRRRVGLNLLRFRRALGLLAFTYAALHLAVWVALDLQFRWGQIGGDILRRPYLLIGFAGFLMMVPLAATSRDSALRRMGAAAWRRLHRLAYPAALAGALHFLWLVKGWPAEPLAWLAAVVVLLALRVLPEGGIAAWARRRHKM